MPLGYGILMFSPSNNSFVGTAVTLSGSQLRKTRKQVNPQKDAVAAPPLLGASTLRVERTATYQHSGLGDFASPSSTITRGIKETEAKKRLWTQPSTVETGTG